MYPPSDPLETLADLAHLDFQIELLLVKNILLSLATILRLGPSHLQVFDSIKEMIELDP